MSSFNKLVFDKDIQVNSIAYMRLDQYDSPFVLEDNTTNCWTLYDVIQGEAAHPHRRGDRRAEGRDSCC